ncbi:MAG: ATP-dependent RecD-like DNA helicase [Eubacteriales bacterium]|nr:ATP-dependent RecD-like DNA helicase [Eubacteriales bacterium]
MTEIIFRNEENGYTVFSMDCENDDEMVCVGSFIDLDVGLYLHVGGQMVVHPSYGEQLSVREYTVIQPENAAALERYLGSGAIRGIGPVLAKRIVKKFGEEASAVLENDPESLATVKGISMRKASEIVEQFVEKSEQRATMMFMQNFGLSIRVATRLYQKYRMDTLAVLRKNPYQIIEDIRGVGFKTADAIAVQMGIAANSEARIFAAVVHVLQSALQNGDTYMPAEELKAEALALLQIEVADFDALLTEMMFQNRIRISDGAESPVYLDYVYQTEVATALRIHELSVRATVDAAKMNRELDRIQERLQLDLDDRQRAAVTAVAENGFTVITGGPGTGKTTIVRAILEYFLSREQEVALAAPTGRAAKRMTEATGFEAKTVHRLLEVGGDPEAGASFGRNEDYPIDADLVIVDEASMIDIFLMHALLKAVATGTRFVLVGDHCQLPSVGPGCVLRDILDAGCVRSIALERIYRQREDSTIVGNAYKILRGETIDVRENHDDFYFIGGHDAADVIDKAVRLIGDRLPAKLGLDAGEFQVLSPTKQGALGVDALNEALQEGLNPPAKNKREIRHMDRVFREGDKVMQIKNNYNTPWALMGEGGILSRGAGVFNGDIGYVQKVNPLFKEVTVLFDDNREVTYEYKMLDELERAYAVTVHKSQGSEYPAVVLILFGGPRLLLTRNILYTAVTRAARCVVVLGNMQTFQDMVDNASMRHRRTSLAERIAAFEELAE